MRRFVIFGVGIMMIFILSVFLAFIQLLIHNGTKSDPKVAVNVACAVEDTITDNDKVVLKLDCQGQKKVTIDPEAVVSYLKNPGPLTCTIYKSGKVNCRSQQVEQ